MATTTENDISMQVDPEAFRPPERVTTPLPAERPRGRAVAILLPVAIFVASMLLNTFRQAESVDIKSDEATYVIESVSLYRTGMTQWDGGPFLVHPPLFFMIEGAYFGALGIGQGPLFDRLISKGYVAGQALLPPGAPAGGETMFDAIYAGRLLSALYGALTAVMLFFLGSALLDRRLGLLAALLFMLDPYVVWRHHLNYLEPLATLFGVIMFYQYATALGRSSGRKRALYFLLAGVFFGLALLTKELALLYALPLIVHWLLFRRLRWSEALLPIVTGGAIYLLFPIWAAANGQSQTWWDTRNWLFNRLTGQIKDSGIDRPGSPFVQTLLTNLPDYWPWFLLMGAAGLLALLFVYLRFRRGLRDAPAELLASLVIGTYVFFLLVGLMGGVINEHFFYFLMPFVVTAVAYAVLAWPRLAHQMRNSEFAIRNGSERAASSALRITHYALLVGLFLLLGYNLVAWVARYGFSRDDSYAQVEGKLAQTLPPGTTIVGRDLVDLYLLPRQNVYTFSYLNLVGRNIDPANIQERRIPFAILNDQSLLEQYGGANSVYYDWVHRSGNVVKEFQGRLYNTYLYQIDYSRPEQAYNADSIAVRRPAVASSVENPVEFTAADAFDARITTRWASKETDNEWIYVDLGQSMTISKIVLTWEEAYAKSYQLQVSDDAINWRTFYSTNQGAGGLETINARAQGRYVRLLMTKRGTNYGYSIWDFAIYP